MAGGGHFAEVIFDYGERVYCESAELAVGGKSDHHGPVLRIDGELPLDNIITTVSDEPGAPMREVRRIHLEYNSGLCVPNFSPIRQLIRITETGTDRLGVAASTRPIEFSYGPTARPYDELSVFDGGGPTGGTTAKPTKLTWGHRNAERVLENTVESMLIDLDGDGRLDRIFSDYSTAYNGAARNASPSGTSMNGCGMVWLRNQGNEFSKDSISPAAGSSSVPIKLPRINWRYGNAMPGPGELCSLTGQVTAARNTVEQALCGTKGSTRLVYRFMDVDADGLPDLVTALYYLDSLYAPGADASWPPTPITKTVEDGSIVDPHFTPGETDPTICDGEVEPEMGTQFNMYWYRNQGAAAGFFDLAAPKFMSAPIDLSPNVGASRTLIGSGGSRVSYGPSSFEDIDGDGKIDAIWSDGYNNREKISAGQEPKHEAPTLLWSVHFGDGEGGFHAPAGDFLPYPWPVPKGAQVSAEVRGLSVEEGMNHSLSELVDVNADGLVDLVYWYNEEPNVLHWPSYQTYGSSRIYLNNGYGFEGNAQLSEGAPLTSDPQRPASTTSMSAFLNLGPLTNQGYVSFKNAIGDSRIRFSDFDSDGRPDLFSQQAISVPASPYVAPYSVSSNPRLYINPGLGTLLTPASSYGSIAAASGFMEHKINLSTYAWEVTDDFVDLNGDGEPEMVSASRDGLFNLKGRNTGDQPLRLLNRIDNGLGGITEIRYAAQNDPIVATSSQSGTAMMPTHVWVVKDVTYTDTLSNTMGVSSVKYGDPTWNQDMQGKWGFRGFRSIETSNVHATNVSSGFAVTEQKYDYDIDWSGRLSETAVYPHGFPSSSQGFSQVASVSRATIAMHSLFDGTVLSYLTEKSESRNCGSQTGGFQTYNECTQGLPTHVVETTWRPLKSDLDTSTAPGLAYYAAASVTYGALGKVDIAGTAFASSDYKLYSDATHYWQMQSDAELQIGRDSGARFSVSHETWVADETLRYQEFASSDGVDLGTGMFLTSRMARDANTGLVTEVQAPQQLEKGLRSTLSYAGYQTQPVSTKDYKGNIAKFTVDMGTGAVLTSRGPNALPCNPSENAGSRTKYDGFGRALRGYVNGCEGGVFGETLASEMQYIDYDGVVPAHSIATSYRDAADLSQNTRGTTYMDGSGRTMRSVIDDGSPEGIVSTSVFDGAGRLVRSVAPNPSTSGSQGGLVDIGYSYDSLGRVIEVRQAPTIDGANASGMDIGYSFDGTYAITTSSEHATDTGPRGETITYSDFFGRLSQVDELLASGGYASTFYDYDGTNSSQIVAYPYRPGLRITDADGIVTEIEEDLSGRRTKLIRGEREWSYQYDKNGNLRFETSPNAIGENASTPGAYSTQTIYDDLDRPTSRILAKKEHSAAQLESFDAFEIGFNYDLCANGIGRLCSVSSGHNLTTNYVYDYAGRVIEEHQDIELPESIVDFADANSDADFNESRITYIKYNLAGAVTEAWLADGATQANATHLSYSFDALGSPKTMTYHGLYGPSSDVVTSVERNKAQLITQQRTACLGRSWAYDHKGRVKRTQVRTKNCTTQNGVLLSEQMTYTGSSEVDTHKVYRAGLPSHNFTYSYDPQHQLAGATNNVVGAGGYNVGFAYTDAGRLLEVGAFDGAGIEGRSAMDYMGGYGDGTLTGGDYHAPVDLLGDTDVHYSYDSAGNAIRRQEIDSTGVSGWNFSYDGINQQREVVLDAATGAGHTSREQYFYDGAGARYMAVTYADATDVLIPSRIRLWVGGAEIWYAPNAAGDAMEVTASYAHLSIGALNVGRVKKVPHPSCQTLNEPQQSKCQVSYQTVTTEASFHNGLGHLMGAVDWKSGVVNAAFVYGPYGEILDSIGGQENEHLRRFNGKESDEISSLGYYGYRYYDALSLSWTQADPLYVAAPDIAGANPREMTLYAFSLNNPIRYMDPDGLQASGDGWNCPDCTGGETVIIYGLPIDDPKSSENSLEEGLKQEAYRIQNGLRAQVNAIWYSGEKKKRGSYGWDWEGHRRLANAVHKRVTNVILGAYLCNTPSSCLKGAVFSAAGGLAGKGLSALVKTKMAQKLAAKLAAKISSLFAKCFAAGTLIETEDGLRPIEEIEIGDLVWSRDDKTGE